MRQRILLAAVTGLAVLAPAAAASADSSQFTTVEAPGELVRGAPDQALDEIQSLGADAVRIQVTWASLAPDPAARRKPAGFNGSDPSAYSGWEDYDAAIQGARSRGLKVDLTLTGAAPAWASSKGDGLTNPNATEFGKFATAVGRRYGREINNWSIWNEPNLGKLLKPIYNGARLASPTTYRNLYLKAYAGLRSAGVRAPVLVGELAPQRNSSRTVGTVAPITFLRSMLCLDGSYKPVKVGGRACAKLPAQGFAIHPYSTRPGPFLVPADQGNVTIGVLSRLSTALDKAGRAGAIPARLPIYITEFGVQSFPDKRLGVPLDVQSDYRSIAERISWLNPRVKSFSQYLLQDDPGTGYEYGAFESGLFLNVGRKQKPAYDGFRLPLVVVPVRGSTTRAGLWGLVRPARKAHRSGSVTLEYKDRSGGWKKLGTQRFASTGYWKRSSVTTKPGRQWRVTWKAPDGTTYRGSATKEWTKPW